MLGFERRDGVLDIACCFRPLMAKINKNGQKRKRRHVALVSTSGCARCIRDCPPQRRTIALIVIIMTCDPGRIGAIPPQRRLCGVTDDGNFTKKPGNPVPSNKIGNILQKTTQATLLTQPLRDKAQKLVWL